MRPGALAAACAHRMQVPAARNALRGGLGWVCQRVARRLVLPAGSSSQSLFTFVTLPEREPHLELRKLGAT